MRTFVAAMLFTAASLAWAQEMTFEITIKDHKFTPSELSVPSNTKIKLVVKNEDPTPAEFESKKLKREKVIPGKSQATIFVGPLKPGEYPFVDEYHEKTTTGKLIAK
jgi:plastocyanin